MFLRKLICIGLAPSSFWSLTEDNYAWFNKSSFGYFFYYCKLCNDGTIKFLLPWEICNYIYNLGDWVENASGSQYGLGLSAKIRAKGVHKLDELEIIWHFSYNNPFSLTFSMLFLFILHQRNMTKETALALACIKHFINHWLSFQNFKICWLLLKKFQNILTFTKI